MFIICGCGNYGTDNGEVAKMFGEYLHHKIELETASRLGWSKQEAYNYYKNEGDYLTPYQPKQES